MKPGRSDVKSISPPKKTPCKMSKRPRLDVTRTKFKIDTDWDEDLDLNAIEEINQIESQAISQFTGNQQTADLQIRVQEEADKKTVDNASLPKLKITEIPEESAQKTPPRSASLEAVVDDRWKLPKMFLNRQDNGKTFSLYIKPYYDTLDRRFKDKLIGQDVSTNYFESGEMNEMDSFSDWADTMSRRKSYSQLEPHLHGLARQISFKSKSTKSEIKQILFKFAKMIQELIGEVESYELTFTLKKGETREEQILQQCGHTVKLDSNIPYCLLTHRKWYSNEKAVDVRQGCGIVLNLIRVEPSITANFVEFELAPRPAKRKISTRSRSTQTVSGDALKESSPSSCLKDSKNDFKMESVDEAPSTSKRVSDNFTCVDDPLGDSSHFKKPQTKTKFERDVNTLLMGLKSTQIISDNFARKQNTSACDGANSKESKNELKMNSGNEEKVDTSKNDVEMDCEYNSLSTSSKSTQTNSGDLENEYLPNCDNVCGSNELKNSSKMECDDNQKISDDAIKEKDGAQCDDNKLTREVTANTKIENGLFSIGENDFTSQALRILQKLVVVISEKSLTMEYNGVFCGILDLCGIMCENHQYLSRDNEKLIVDIVKEITLSRPGAIVVERISKFLRSSLNCPFVAQNLCHKSNRSSFVENQKKGIYTFDKGTCILQVFLATVDFLEKSESLCKNFESWVMELGNVRYRLDWLYKQYEGDRCSCVPSLIKNILTMLCAKHSRHNFTYQSEEIRATEVAFNILRFLASLDNFFTYATLCTSHFSLLLEHMKGTVAQAGNDYDYIKTYVEAIQKKFYAGEEMYKIDPNLDKEKMGEGLWNGIFYPKKLMEVYKHLEIEKSENGDEDEEGKNCADEEMEIETEGEKSEEGAPENLQSEFSQHYFGSHNKKI